MSIKIHERRKGCPRWGITPLVALIFLVAFCGRIWAQTPGDTLPPSPPSGVTAFDTPNDAGRNITLNWKLSSDDGGGRNTVMRYDILRSESRSGEFELVGSVVAGISTFHDDKVENRKYYFYKIRAKDHLSSESEIVGPVETSGQWYNTNRTVVLIFVVLFTSLIIYFVNSAKRGKKLYVRPIPGMDAVDEAVGRATEMGRPILYILGLSSISDVATIASLTILGRVAKKVAEFQSKLLVPCYNPIVMTVAQEVVKNAYLDAGRPDAYDESNIWFLSQSQFAYAAGVNGIMLREKTATNFYLGMFFAESLILAETGNIAGSIQIAGTDAVVQLPFFITSCDYTLIGEEFYAASAYLSREPKLLGSIKAQDLGKAGLITLIILGGFFASLHIDAFVNLFTVGH